MSFLNKILLFVFLSSPTLLFAKTEKVGLTLLPVSNLDFETTKQVLDSLSQKLLEKKFKVTLLVDTSLQKIKPSQESFSLKTFYKKAEEEQLHLHYAASIEILNKALNQLSKTEMLEDSDLKVLPDFYLLLAYAYKNTNNKTLYNESLKEAARLKPHFLANEWSFPPSLLKDFEKERDLLLKGKNLGGFIVESNPASARVFINGDFQGVTPVHIEKFPSGVHFLSVTSDKNRYLEKVNLEPNALKKINADFSKKEKKKKKETFETTLLNPSDFALQKLYLEKVSKKAKSSKIMGVVCLTNQNTKSFSILVHSIGFGKEPQTITFKQKTTTAEIADKIIEAVLP